MVGYIKMIKHVSNHSEYLKLITNSSCIVKFTAEWCGPCKKIAPLFQTLATENGTVVNFIEVDIDPTPKIASYESIQSVPQFLFYNRGVKVDELTILGANTSKLIANFKLFLAQVPNEKELEELKKLEVPEQAVTVVVGPAPTSEMAQLILDDQEYPEYSNYSDSDSDDYAAEEYPNNSLSESSKSSSPEDPDNLEHEVVINNPFIRKISP